MLPEPSIRLIIECVSGAFGVSARDIVSPRRSAECLQARWAVYLLARELTTKSYPAIGRAIGDRDHSTVLEGVRRAQKCAEESEAFRDLVGAARAAIETMSIVVHRRHERAVQTAAMQSAAMSQVAARLADTDPLALARAILDGGHAAAMSAAPLQVFALAGRVAACEELGALAARLVAVIDERDDPLVTPLRRRELAIETQSLIPEIARVLRDVGHSTQTENAHGKSEQAEDCGTEPAGAANAR